MSYLWWLPAFIQLANNQDRYIGRTFIALERRLLTCLPPARRHQIANIILLERYLNPWHPSSIATTFIWRRQPVYRRTRATHNTDDANDEIRVERLHHGWIPLCWSWIRNIRTTYAYFRQRNGRQQSTVDHLDDVLNQTSSQPSTLQSSMQHFTCCGRNFAIIIGDPSKCSSTKRFLWPNQINGYSNHVNPTQHPLFNDVPFGGRFDEPNLNWWEMRQKYNAAHHDNVSTDGGHSDREDCAIFFDGIGYRGLYMPITNTTRGRAKNCWSGWIVTPKVMITNKISHITLDRNHILYA